MPQKNRVLLIESQSTAKCAIARRIFNCRGFCDILFLTGSTVQKVKFIGPCILEGIDKISSLGPRLIK